MTDERYRKAYAAIHAALTNADVLRIFLAFGHNERELNNLIDTLTDEINHTKKSFSFTCSLLENVKMTVVRLAA